MSSTDHSYALLLGSNMGDRASLLSQAFVHIGESIGTVTAASKVYASAPWGFEADSDFLNQCVIVNSSLSPTELLTEIHAVELKMGRKRPVSSGYSSRTIDIDILHWDGGIVAEPELSIPHARLHERRFALTPLSELLGSEFHLGMKRTYNELLDSCPDKGIIHEVSMV